MSALRRFICLLRGIHDVPGNPRKEGEPVVAESREAALDYAAGRYGLHDAPAGSAAIPVAEPTSGAQS